MKLIKYISFGVICAAICTFVVVAIVAAGLTAERIFGLYGVYVFCGVLLSLCVAAVAYGYDLFD